MKHWTIGYTVKYKSGYKVTSSQTLEAREISLALALAVEGIQRPILKQSHVADVVVWGVEMEEDDVFDDEEVSQTLDEAHERCVNGDRILRIKGVLKGTWYQDHVMDYVNEHKYEPVDIVDETDEMVTVQMRRNK